MILNKTDMDELEKYSDFGGAEKYRHRYGKYYIEEGVTNRHTAA